ncbi:hypothetical protein H0H92_005562 [Tricholoma furcatifolium]|nr:hypothetical protein H0H92_005562 [Tricholoma furcatifolium]
MHSYGLEVVQLTEKIRNAEPTLGTLCVEYLMAPTLHVDPYLSDLYDSESGKQKDLSRLVGSESGEQQTPEDKISTRHPFFHFAINHWPYFLLRSHVRLASNPDFKIFLEAILAFISDPSAVEMWLEHYMRQSHLDALKYIIQEFMDFKADINPTTRVLITTCVHWARKVDKVLRTYAVSLLLEPNYIRFCYEPLIAAPVTHESSIRRQLLHNSGDIAPLEINFHHAIQWIHYDPVTDTLFSVDLTGITVRLSRRILSTGRMLPSLFARRYPSTFDFHSFAMDPSNGGMAAILLYQYMHRTFELLIVCWRLRFVADEGRPTTSSDIILYDTYTMIKPFLPFQSNIAFSGGEKLITPGFIYDLSAAQNIQRLRKPNTISESIIAKLGQIPHISNGYLNSDGSRAAYLIEDSPGPLLPPYRPPSQFPPQVEVRNLRNNCIIYARTLSWPFHISAFSPSGRKLITQGLGTPCTFTCHFIDDGYCLELTTPIYYFISQLKLTSDEEMLVAAGHRREEAYRSLLNQKFGIFMWNLKLGEGNDNLNGNNIPGDNSCLYLSSSFNATFTLVPRILPEERSDTILILNGENGVITRGSLDKMRVAGEENHSLAAIKVEIEDFDEKIFNIKTFCGDQ